MQTITSTAELKNAIQLLKAEQASKEQLLKEQFHHACESLRPVNLLRNTVKEIASSPNLIDNILATAMGLATGYLSKKIIIGVSGNLFRKILGSVLQLGITNVVVQHPDTVKPFRQFIFKHLLRKKANKSESRDS